MGCCGKKEEEQDYDYENSNGQKKSNGCRITLQILKYTSIVLFILIILFFIVFFVIFPIIFMQTVALQRFLMFPNYDQPENPQYENYKKYDAVGVKNFYVSVRDLHDSDKYISLGIWQVVPKDRMDASQVLGFNYTQELLNSQKPIAIYFHGQSGTRIYPLPTYNVIREFFHVIAFDYRSYGDSTDALLTELAVVNDAVQLYEWVRRNTKQEEIYFWGHSLGTALSTHTIKKIKEKGRDDLPKGLVLEAPFTTMREEVAHHPLGKIFAWLPWFAATIQDPLEENGFRFYTSENINSVDSPIMILHAEDDSVIPCTLGQKLHQQATENRRTDQGSVRLHIVPASYRSDHMEINKYPKLPELISDFMNCINNSNGCLHKPVT